MARQRKATPRRTRSKSSRAKRARPPMTSTAVFEAYAVGLKPDTLTAQRALARTIARAAIPGGAEVEFLQRDRSTKAAKRDITITPRAGIEVAPGTAWERAPSNR